MIPRSAQSIVDLRLRGERPTDPVVVSFVGSSEWDGSGPTVYANPGTVYDWRFLVALPVMVLVRPGIDVRRAIEAINEVARPYPLLIDVERKAAADILETKPLRMWNVWRESARYRTLFA